eukprot:2733036-Pleurochrysis_carterae.AAC.1
MRAPGVSSTSSEPRDAPAALRDGGGRHRAGRDWAGRDEVGLPLEPAQGLSLRHGGGARGRRREEEVLDAVALVRKVRVRHERRLRLRAAAAASAKKVEVTRWEEGANFGNSRHAIEKQLEGREDALGQQWASSEIGSIAVSLAAYTWTGVHRAEEGEHL